MVTWLESFTAFYHRLIQWTSNLQSVFLFWLRVTWGPQFIVMGWQKIANLSQSVDQLSAIGYAHPVFHSYLTGYIEIIGGLSVLLGFGSRLFPIPLALTTLTILSKAHGSDWKSLLHPSLIAHQPPYPFLIVALIVLVFGPGKLSLDGWIKRRIHTK